MVYTLTKNNYKQLHLILVIFKEQTNKKNELNITIRKEMLLKCNK